MKTYWKKRLNWQERSCTPAGSRTGGMQTGFLPRFIRRLGFICPFTIADQRSMSCIDSDLTQMSGRERNNYFSNLSPGTQLYSASSAFIYLGSVNGVHYILHPATSFFVGETRYTANSILITTMDVIQESGLSYYDAMTLGRVFGIAG